MSLGGELTIDLYRQAGQIRDVRIASSRPPRAARLFHGNVMAVASATQAPCGIGLAQLEAARGRLVHRVELVDGRIGRYQIVAPTEWNFHPHGPVATGLRKLPNVDDTALRLAAGLLISGVDPCVDYVLSLH